jgi:glyoxylase-like metal-dependent hydrolase (beta-lactamase superfamily II)
MSAQSSSFATVSGGVPAHVHVERLEADDAPSHAFLVADLQARVAAVIDPVDAHVDAYLARLERADLTLVAVLDTHTHADHVSGAPRLARATGAPLVMHHQAPRACVSRRVRHGDVIEVGALTLEVLATPGHTYDGMSIWVGDFLFAGDLFEVGARPHGDEACANASALADSLALLARLPGGTLVYGTHGPQRVSLASAIGHARRVLRGEEADAARSRLGNDVRMPTHAATFAVLEANLACDVHDARVGDAAHAEAPRVDVDTLAEALRSPHPPVVLDVRSADEFFDRSLGRIPGAVLLPLEHLAAEAPMLREMHVPIVVACRTTPRALLGAGALTAAGLQQVSALEGGLLAWKAHGHPIEREP